MSCRKSSHGWVIQIQQSYLGESGDLVDTPEEAKLFERLILVWPEIEKLKAMGIEGAAPDEWIDN